MFFPVIHAVSETEKYRGKKSIIYKFNSENYIHIFLIGFELEARNIFM